MCLLSIKVVVDSYVAVWKEHGQHVVSVVNTFFSPLPQVVVSKVSLGNVQLKYVDGTQFHGCNEQSYFVEYVFIDHDQLKLLKIVFVYVLVKG